MHQLVSLTIYYFFINPKQDVARGVTGLCFYQAAKHKWIYFRRWNYRVQYRESGVPAAVFTLFGKFLKSLSRACLNRVVTIKFVHSRKCKTRTFFVNEHLDATAKGRNERWRRIIKSLVSFSEKKATRLEFGGEFAWLRALRPNRLSVEFSLLFCFSSV